MSNDGVRGPGSPLRIGFFGNFYPRVDRLSSTSVGLVYFLSLSSGIQSVHVLAPRGCELPPGMNATKVTLDPVWEFDDPPSLLRAMMILHRKADELDLVVFNVYLTSFGQSGTSNGVGLLLPFVTSFFVRRSPVVYMHNFVETQDLDRLGYSHATLRTFVARILERLLTWRCDVVAPLGSQQRTLESVLGGTVRYGIVPFAEAVPSILTRTAPYEAPSAGRAGRLRILLFGSWGPQKDSEGIVKMLAEIARDGLPFEAVIAGGINPNFPGYKDQLAHALASARPLVIALRLGIPESDVAHLFRSCDVLILPYHATGGYSAVMNVACYYRLPVLAYDLPELRECAEAIGADCEFFNPGDTRTLVQLLKAIPTDRSTPSEIVAPPEVQFSRSIRAVEELVGVGPSAAHRPSSTE